MKPAKHVFGAGGHMIWPWLDSIYSVNVKLQPELARADSCMYLFSATCIAILILSVRFMVNV